MYTILQTIRTITSPRRPVRRARKHTAVAKNVGGRRIGAIRGRTQFRLPSGHYAKRDRRTGEILSIKADRKPYKNVVIEKTPPTDIDLAALPGRRGRARRGVVTLLRQPARDAA